MSTKTLAPAAMLLISLAPIARADIIIDHQPLPSGGPSSDTLFINDFNQQSWQLLADDITLAAPATARQLTFWGFFGSSLSCNIQPPSGSETVRIRFYDSRPSDGLPGQLLYEVSFVNPSRVDTGQIVLVGCGPHEFRYQVDLTTPFDLQPTTTYWLEIAQVGDINSLFRWENSANAEINGYAYYNAFIPDWLHTVNNPVSDRAFELSTTPEPSTEVLTLFAAIPFFVHVSTRIRDRGRQGV